MVRYLDALFDRETPDVVIAPWVGDSHGDHVRLARAALSASRRTRASLYAYMPGELRSACFTAFSPNAFVDIRAYEEKKVAAMEAYSYEGQGFRRLDTAATVRIARAYGTVAGCTSAEGFIVLRQLGIGLVVGGRN